MSDQPLELISKDETIRLECLSLSVQSFEPTGQYAEEFPIIERARYFEQYVRNGAFEKNAGTS